MDLEKKNPGKKLNEICIIAFILFVVSQLFSFIYIRKSCSGKAVHVQPELSTYLLVGLILGLVLTGFDVYNYHVILVKMSSYLFTSF